MLTNTLGRILMRENTLGMTACHDEARAFVESFLRRYGGTRVLPPRTESGRARESGPTGIGVQSAILRSLRRMVLTSVPVHVPSRTGLAGESERAVGEAKARGPYAKTAARRAEIVRAARDSFAEKGYAKASLRDIAERAGITHAGLLHHFRNKDELLAEVLAQRDAEEWAHGVAHVERPAQLPSYLAELIRHHQQAPELMRLWIELAAAASRPGHPAHDYFVERYARGRAQFADGFADEAARARLRGGVSPENAALLFHAVLSGLQLQWVLDQELDIVGPVNDFVRLLFEEEDSGTADG